MYVLVQQALQQRILQVPASSRARLQTATVQMMPLGYTSLHTVPFVGQDSLLLAVPDDTLLVPGLPILEITVHSGETSTHKTPLRC